MNVEIANENATNALNRQRSAIAPVGMVAVVSMKTIWNRNSVPTPVV